MKKISRLGDPNTQRYCAFSGPRPYVIVEVKYRNSINIYTFYLFKFEAFHRVKCHLGLASLTLEGCFLSLVSTKMFRARRVAALYLVTVETSRHHTHGENIKGLNWSRLCAFVLFKLRNLAVSPTVHTLS